MTRHLITNEVITIAENGLTAESRSYVTVLQRSLGMDFHIVVVGRYHDRFEQSGNAWRFTEKRIAVDHLHDIENHFRITAEHSS